MSKSDSSERSIVRAPSREVSIARDNMASRALAMVGKPTDVEKLLTKKIAERYLADSKSATALEYTVIEDEAAEIQEAILMLPKVHEGRDTVTERVLRRITQSLDWGEQRRMWLADARNAAYREALKTNAITAAR